MIGRTVSCSLLSLVGTKGRLSEPSCQRRKARAFVIGILEIDRIVFAFNVCCLKNVGFETEFVVCLCFVLD